LLDPVRGTGECGIPERRVLRPNWRQLCPTRNQPGGRGLGIFMTGSQRLGDAEPSDCAEEEASNNYGPTSTPTRGIGI
jgi:hypothetical protein